MEVGVVVAKRFRLEQQAGTGGFGRVFRATDLLTGELVAVKILYGDRHVVAERLAREVQVLTLLDHPGIVRYVDHGPLGTDDYYLVMEWLDGEDLSARLARESLTLGATLEMMTNIADALSHAHARQIIHRDIKPANIFLPTGASVSAVKLVDFGIAKPIERRRERGTRARAGDPSATGNPIGTVGYMSPEQACGDRRVDARADVFALGCVLFECLTGRAVFAGQHAIAVLAKILLEKPARLSGIAKMPVPAWLDELVASMLSLDPEARPLDAGAFARQLRERHADLRAREIVGSSPRLLTTYERRLVTALAVRPTDAADARPSTIAAEHGEALERFVDGSWATILRVSDGAADTVSRAARLALALRPFGNVAVATSFDEVNAARPTSTVIDRVFNQLESATGSTAHLALVDELTAGLIDGAFQVQRDFAIARAGGGLLIGPRADLDPPRMLLGKPTPFVGREKEMGILTSTLSATISEPAASAVFILGPAGAGKSRLRHELLIAAAEQHPRIRVLMVRAEPARQSTALGAVGALVASEATLREEESPAQRRAKLLVRLANSVPPHELNRVADFLGELVGAPNEDPSLQLQGAKADPRRMWAEILRSVEDWITAELAVGPVLLVLEDIQWIDAQSLHLFAELLSKRERPLFLLGLGRPSARAMVANTGWQARPLHLIQLPPLGSKASHQLVRGTLGDSIAEDRLEAIVSRGEGHAFSLEELVRAEAEGHGATAPPTVVAMLQERFDRFEGDARRILRAASVLGLEFTKAGLLALLAEKDAPADWIDPWLRTLVSREVIATAERSRFNREQTFEFRHDIIRDAVYATLTDDDRQRGHLLAAHWLESVNERDQAVLGQHFEQGRDPERAAVAFARAAEHAYKRMDFAAAQQLCERSIANNASGSTLGWVRWVQASVALSNRTMDDTERFGSEALDLLPERTTHWFHAATLMATVAAFGRPDLLGGVVAKVLHAGVPAVSELGMAPIRTWALTANMLYMAGQYPLAAEFDDRIDRCAELAIARESVAKAWVHFARHVKASYCAGDPELTLDEAERAADILDQSSDEILVWVRVEEGKAAGLIGDFARAERLLLGAINVAGTDNVWAAGLARHRLARICLFVGRLDEARKLEHEAIKLFHDIGMPIMAAIGDNHLAMIELAAGNIDTAEQAILRARELLVAVPPIRSFALATQALIALANGNPEAARNTLSEADRSLPTSGLINDGESLYDLAWIETHLALGDHAKAAARARSAAGRLGDRASRITRNDYRESFCNAVPENARIFAHARSLEPSL